MRLSYDNCRRKSTIRQNTTSSKDEDIETLNMTDPRERLLVIFNYEIRELIFYYFIVKVIAVAFILWYYVSTKKKGKLLLRQTL